MPSTSTETALAVRQLIAAGDLAAAAARCAALVHRQPNDPDAWALAAEVALRDRKPHAAAQFLQRASGCAPHDAGLLIRYGQCLQQLGRRKDALAAARLAETLRLADATLHDALGTLLTHLEEPVRALPHFRRAAALAPATIEFCYNLAMAERMAGDLDAAEAHLDRVLDARPQDGEAHHARSDLRRQTPERNHVVPLRTALDALRGRRAAIPVEFALAKELEDLGEYADAFGHLHAACSAHRASFRYDVADDVAVLDKLRAAHTQSVVETLRSECTNAETIFIVGLPRSGTTLVERIVASHPEVFAGGEWDAFPRVAIEALARQYPARVTKLEFVDRTLALDFTSLGAAYIETTRPRTGHTAKFTDKLPVNYLYAGLIRAALPRARFVALRRHPLDSCYAMYKTLFAAAYPFTYDLGELARYYVAWERLMRHWAQVIGEAWLTVDYEELVVDQERVSRRIVAHCGLGWDARCLQFHAQNAAVTTASAVQVRRPLYADSVGKWRHYARQLEPVSRYLQAQGIVIE